ncbi:hypothetical protein ACLG6S_08345 [Thermodesulfobacteriota bacterium B35]
MRGHITIMLLALTLLAAPAVPAPALADGTVNIDSALWDQAVSSLLAAGMYGLAPSTKPGMDLHLEQSQGVIRGLAPGQAWFTGHAITFSYRGSSGLLGFSAGYIYTSDRMPAPAHSMFAGPDPQDGQGINPADDWFMAIDLSRAYQVHNDLAIGLGGRTMLKKNPVDSNRGRMLSFLLNMPMSYKNFITITPELQWSHSLSEASLSTTGNGNVRAPIQDIFYGGVSVTFSY